MSGQAPGRSEATPWSALDRCFATSVAALAQRSDPELWLTAALVSQRTGEGHVCVSLPRLAGTPLDTEGEPARWPELGRWCDLLLGSGIVGDGSRLTPLVLDERRRLYLYRYWEHEQTLARLVNERVAQAPEVLDVELLQDGLSRLFGAPTATREDRQRWAAASAVLSRLSLVTGGPGTGKTHVAIRIVVLLEEQAQRLGRPSLGTLLLAPTGKATQRLVETVRGAREKLSTLSGAWQAVPEQAQTVHRALGASGRGATQFRHNSTNPLLADTVIVDESSMIDLPLMRRLFEAVSPRARIVLLGDAHQLASVEAGAVFGDLCALARHGGYSSAWAEQLGSLIGERLPVSELAPPGGIQDRIVELTESHRFSDSGGIGALAAQLRRGDGEAALDTLRRGGAVGLTQFGSPSRLGRALKRILVEGYADLFRTRDPARALAAFGQFRVLAVHRRGPMGVEALNRLIEQVLRREGWLEPRGEHAVGRPLLIEENDYQVGLYNGDVGILLRDGRGELKAFFEAGDGQVRALSPARLPQHQTAFAMTVHKSQGSEFRHVALVLPDSSSPLLTRELLYTAVTRAKERVSVYGSAESVVQGARRRVERGSGLGDLLRQHASRGRCGSADG